MPPTWGANSAAELPQPKKLRFVLRTGYGFLIALLIVSAIEAYHIQVGVSEEAGDLYGRYSQQQETLGRVRRNALLAAGNARDLFLNTAPDRIATFRSQINVLEDETVRDLDALDNLPATMRPPAALRDAARRYWSLLKSPEIEEEMDPGDAYRFIQDRVVPLRNAVANIARVSTEITQTTFSAFEQELHKSRRVATGRLFMMLALCLLTALAVARFVLGYAENVEREKTRRYFEALQGKNELEQLSGRLLEVQEEERKRLSRELHDEIGQIMTALRMEISHAQALLDTASTVRVKERLGRARDLADRTVKMVRNISLLLRPSLLDDLGLGPALQREAETFRERTGIRCDFEEQGLSQSQPEPINTCVYRVVQEALNNCQKHSAASRVRVSAKYQPGEILVRIEDNGKGFELDKEGAPRQSGCLGLLGMRERASLLGGALELESAPGSGTRVTLRLPTPVEPASATVAAREATA
jgi:signal transduction histidine kinase